MLQEPGGRVTLYFTMIYLLPLNFRKFKRNLQSRRLTGYRL